MMQSDLEERLLHHLGVLYGDRAAALLPSLYQLISRHLELRQGERLEGAKWSERDIMLITYADSVHYPGLMPLAGLKQFLDRRLHNVFSIVHLLPFFPYSSDDGFSVSDFRSVNSDLGDWDDIGALKQNFDLMFDLVLNHMSREHLWFVNYVQDLSPGKDYVIEVDDEAATKLSMVVRPRASPLLSRVRTPRGNRYVWATFSNDQIDLNYANPEVLFELIDTLLDYIRHGARAIRLDAVAFLWKELGTECIHLAQTHTVVKLLRCLIEVLEPGAILLTETNVPHAENISYFGDGDEADMIYQFSLPPLILHAMQCESTRYLTSWATDLSNQQCPVGCTYLNFTASHDGIGLRPLEGLIPDDEIDQLIVKMRARGAFVAMRANSDGRDRPYELNISYFDAFRDPDKRPDRWHVSRFSLAQTIPLALQGIPAVYINALAATPNDPAGVEHSGMTRSINRRKWDGVELENLIDHPLTETGRVFPEYTRRLKIRQGIKAFHPEAPQQILDLPDGIFGVLRTSLDGEQRVLALHNLKSRVMEVDLAALVADKINWFDVLHQEMPDITGDRIRLLPLQAVWLLPETV